MPSIDQPPPPMPFRHIISLAGVVLAVLIIGITGTGSIVEAGIGAGMLVIILAAVAQHRMERQRQEFLERAVNEPPRSEPMPDDRIREVGR